MAAPVGTGRFASWDGGCLFIGRSVDTVPMHAHYALQLAFGSEPGIRFRSDDAEPWTSYDGVIIASRQPHSMDATHVGFSAVLFVEPETREGRALTERFGDGGMTALPSEVFRPAAAALFDALRSPDASAMAAAARSVVAELTGGMDPSTTSDERILRATAYIGSHLDADVDLETVAEVACLSPSRFRHLFVEETGMALRPYILWRRFIRVWELLAQGASISAAAHAAGFADAAHLTRTSRRMFGLAPSSMQLAGAATPGRVKNAPTTAASGSVQPLRSRRQPLRSRGGGEETVS